MQRTAIRRVGALCVPLAALSLIVACAGSPAPQVQVSPQSAPQSEQKPVPQRKERLVPIKVPVLVKESSFYADGLLDEYVVYKYDAANRLLLERAVYDAARPEPIERVVAEYLEGRLQAETVYDAEGKVKQRREYSLDALGRVLTEHILDAKGQPQSSSTYVYDAEGRRLEWRALDGRGLVKALTTYVYEGGRLVLIDMKDAAGKRTGSIKVEYDAAGLVTRKSYLAADGALQKYEVYVYAAGRLTALELRRADGSLASKVAYETGPLGELIATVDYDASGALKGRKSYEYLVREDQKTEVYYE